jgi:hypothetical protein
MFVRWPLFLLTTSRLPPRHCGASLVVTWEVPMLGDYPTRGPRLWLFIAAVVATGLVGVMLMLFFATKG